MMLSIMSVTTALLLAVILWFLFYQRPANFPPGPRRIPIIGNIELFITPGASLGHRLQSLGRKYGEVVGLYMGNVRLVSLESYDVIREAFTKEVFSARPVNMRSKLRFGGKRGGIVYSEGILWSELRRFCLRNLKDLGFGNRSLESAVLHEVDEVVAQLSKAGGKEVAVTSHFGIAVLNVLWQILAGERLSYDDPLINELVAMVKSDYQVSATSRLLEAVPVVTSLFPCLTASDHFKKKTVVMNNFFSEVIEKHRQTYDESNMRDFIDIFLRQISRQHGEESLHYNEFQLKVLLLDFFEAGIETTTTTLSWSVLLLSLYPEVQERIQREIDDVIGRERSPSLNDRPSLPYTEAVIMEIQRFGCIAPLTTPHRVTSDTTFRGYFIPKDTTVVANLWSVFMDEEYWEDPHTFRPERFFTGGREVQRDERLIPFSVGKRACVGASLSSIELFLFLTRMLQQLSFSLPSDKPAPVLEGKGGLTYAPRPYRVIVTVR